MPNRRPLSGRFNSIHRKLTGALSESVNAPWATPSHERCFAKIFIAVHSIGFLVPSL